jgi:uncharacterized protein
MTLSVVWEWIAEPGLEYLRINEAEEVHVDSVVIFPSGEQISRLHYQVCCTATWNVRAIEIKMQQAGNLKTLNLQHSAEGVWLFDGQVREDLAGCTDFDLDVSPFTNTLPIRRLSFAPNEIKIVKVAYVKLRELMVSPAIQEYCRIGDADPPVKFRYRNLSSGFTTEIVVDAAGIVEDYPGRWRRLL